jgi:hypothetical protein
MHIEHSTNAIQTVWAYGLAGVSAVGGVLHRLIGQTITPPGTEKLVDAGFAGLFILALLWANIMQWRQRIADAKVYQAALDERDRRMSELEKTFRDSYVAELKAGNATRAEMIALMRRRDDRDTP